MALSNISREPRREITETVAGVGIAAVALVPDYFFAIWFMAVAFRPSDSLGWALAFFLSLIIGFICLGLFWLAVLGVHALGEAACEILEDRGIRLRPRR